MRYSSALTKTLSTPIPADTRSPIGQSMASLIPANAKLLEKVEAQGRVFETYDSNGDGFGDITRHYPAEPPGDGFVSNEVIRFQAPQSRDYRAYLTNIDGAGRSSGKVEYFTETSAAGETVHSDDNGDGKVDWVSEPIASLKDFRVEGYDPAYTADRVFNRVLKDTNKDGTFDQETVTGNWWSQVG